MRFLLGMDGFYAVQRVRLGPLDGGGGSGEWREPIFYTGLRWFGSVQFTSIHFIQSTPLFL